MNRLVLALPGCERLAHELAPRIGAEEGERAIRRFPDGESYVRLMSEVGGREVVVVASMDRPDPKVIPLLLLAETARELGAASVGLVAPYLCYLRQDRRFLAGEAVSARIFPRSLSGALDWLVTVDPHLHRLAALSEVWPIPTAVVRAAPVVARWIAGEVERPLLVGPDSESAQWVRDVAVRASAPCVVLEKVRRGDRDIDVHLPEVGHWRDRTPVVIDDIVSTGRTMAETLAQLRRAGMPPAVCIGVHALFAPGALEELERAGARRIVTCDSVPHPTNRIALADALSAAVLRQIEAHTTGRPLPPR